VKAAVLKYYLRRPHASAPVPSLPVLLDFSRASSQYRTVCSPVAIPVAKRPHANSRPRRGPKPDRRRALELLNAASRDGVPEAIMLAHGFSIELLVELVHAGLATASTERMIAGRHPMEVTRVRITEAGRGALSGRSKP
jgi:hypothetical protein